MTIERLKAASMDLLAQRYIELREQKKEIEDAAKAQVEPISEALEQLATAMLAKLHDEGSTTQRTAHGTVYIHTTNTGNIVDFDALWTFVKEHDVPEIFQKRITLSEVEAFNETHPDTPVPGVVTERVQSARVRAK
jgi:D-arabinose 1-dehydrogenase-like Zn-dependent alcohol dehydrogenase